MLGNFSFGDYFKERAIELAWNLVTKEYGLTKDKLLITVYSEDEEAAKLWKKIAGITDDKIIRIPTSDNFWSAGDTGPCGPCSEIFIDQGDKLQGGPPGSADADGDRFLEFWNLVFMQFDQLGAREPRNLPSPSIDTGMGLERISAILQGVTSNYDTDLFKALIEASVAETGVPAKGDKTPSHRVIADHLRATSFLIADGVLPVERGARLRAPPHHAPRHAARASARRQGPADAPPRAGARPADGHHLSRAGARPADDHRDAEARGDPFPQDAGARPWPARRGLEQSAQGRHASRARWPSASTTPTASRWT